MLPWNRKLENYDWKVDAKYFIINFHSGIYVTNFIFQIKWIVEIFKEDKTYVSQFPIALLKLPIFVHELNTENPQANTITTYICLLKSMFGHPWFWTKFIKQILLHRVYEILLNIMWVAGKYFSSTSSYTYVKILDNCDLYDKSNSIASQKYSSRNTLLHQN